MKLLAWDTSSRVGSICTMEWDEASNAGRAGLRLVSEWTLNVQAQHSERLLWAIHQCLEASRWKPADLDLIGVGVGPGSFTGIRIGMTTARTLAQSLGKPLVGISSLAALARPAALWLSLGKAPAVVIAATEACKGELYVLHGAAKAVADCAAMADGDYAGLWKRGVEERVVRPEDLLRALKKKIGKTTPWMAIGDGRLVYPEFWEQLPTRLEIDPPVPFVQHVQARYVGMLAWEACQAGLAREPLAVHPRYLRASDAELKLKAGMLAHNAPTRGLEP